MTTFIPDFLPAFAANLAAMMIKAAGSGFQERFSPSGVQEAVKRCVEHGITALVSSSDELSPKNEHLLIDCFDDYFQYRSVVRELSKILRGKEPDVDELIFLFEEDAGYDLDVLPGLDINQGMQAFLAAFMTSATLEPELNRIIQAKHLIKQTKLQQDILEEMRRLIEFLRKDKDQQIVGIQAGQIEARNVVNGTQIIYESSDTSLPDNTEEQHYLKTLIEKCDVLQLASIDESCTDDGGIRISDVFTSLNLTCQRFPEQGVEDALTNVKEMNPKGESSGKPVPIQAVEAAGSMKRLVILGQPGSGKSTLVNYIASRLALRSLADTEISSNILTDLPGFADDEAPLPIRIILRHFAAWISSDTHNSAGLVWDYIKYMLGQWGCNCYENLRQILQNRGGIIFFDGLDEVSEIDEDSKRSIITESIREFSGPLDKCRVIVTCREYAYKNTDAWRLPETIFPVSELALFDMEQIRAFTHIWYQVIGPQKDWGEAKQKAEAENLYSAIDALPYLKEIAQYPLLLTLMAQVHGRDGSLPNDRADLYERAVNLLLEHWDNRLIRDDVSGTCKRESGLILRLGRIRRDSLRSVLEKLAFTAHEHQEAEKGRTGQCADINRLDLLEAFKDELGSYDKADKVIEYIRERAGLLTDQGNKTYTFPHRTFQEYLAAAYIMKQGEFDTMLFKRVKRDLNWWREVFLLAAGYSKSVPRNVSNMIDIMLAHEPDNSRVTPEQAGFAKLAAQALVETDFINFVKKEKKVTEQGRFSRIFERIQKWLVESLKADETLKPMEREKCGRSLAELGDPRKEVMSLEHMEFCLVPAGVFYMGDGKDRHLNECLNYDYWISRHPVTNAQYDEFVRAGGYEQKQYWKEAEDEGLWEDGKYEGRKSPGNYGSPFNLFNHPVVGVKWYESLAFTRWLTDFWMEQGLFDANWRICLPSEAQWEKAARGGQEIPEEIRVVRALEKAWANKIDMIDNPESDREYPWLGKIDINKVNYDDTDINTTSAAGCFMSGMSPYGCLDMSGNVWEWTRSLYENEDEESYKYPYNPKDGRENEFLKRDISRVVRGGSYIHDSGGVRCAARNRNFPDGRYYGFGFRVLCAPNP